VVVSKNGYQGRSEWRLEDVHSKDAHTRDAKVSIFEQTVENTNLNGIPRSKDAQRSGVNTFDACEDDGEVRL
jgi:hypothetical protein